MKLWHFLSSVLMITICPLATALADDVRDDAIIVRSIQRMQGYDYRSNPKITDAINRHIDRSKGTPDYIRLIKQFRPEGIDQKLQAVVLAADNSAAVEAMQLLCDLPDGPKQVRGLLRGKNTDSAARVAEVLGIFGNGRAHKILGDMSSDEKIAYKIRRTSVAGLARNDGGARLLLQLAKSSKLVGDTRLLAGALLARSRNGDIRKQAASFLPQPKQKDQKPLPPLDELAKIKGNIVNGKKLFQTTATCAKCHIVGKLGKEVGPNLTEIGSKLSKEAMLTSILDPSAGISHNYENYLVLTDEGQTITGLKVSETATEVVIRTAEAVDRRFAKDEIENIKKSDKSIMPENLHHLIDQQGLIDIVEYMLTLKKK